MTSSCWVIAIDGPAGSGKSTVAAALARRLGVEHLETGAMYRAVALVALRRGENLDDAASLGQAARDLPADPGDWWRAARGAGGGTSGDITKDLRSAEVDAVVSKVASCPEVREEMVRRQVAWVRARGRGVVEGRDIGSVVLPDADLKVFLDASEDVRMSRRAAEMEMAGTDGDPAGLLERDRLDSSRGHSPLKVAEGAVVIDTTLKSADEIVDEVLRLLGEIGAADNRQQPSGNGRNCG